MQPTAPALAVPVGTKVWLLRRRDRLLAEVVQPPRDGQVEVRWFLGPARTEQAAVPLDLVEVAKLSSQQRVYVPPGQHWQHGRLVTQVAGQPGSPLRCYFIAL